MPVTPAISKGMEKQHYAGSGRFMLAVHVPFLITLTVLVLYGLVVVRSAITGSSDYSFNRQVIGVGVGVVVMLIIWFFDYRKLANLVLPLLIVDVILLLSPHFPIIGVSNNGAASWVKIGVQFQPGEIAKVVTILLMASVVARYRGKITSGTEYMKCLGICAIPFLCIMTQPDLGTGLVIIIIGATILFVGGANRKWLIITVVIVIVGVVGIIVLDPILDAKMGRDVFIKQYQMNRLTVFINEDIDPTGAGYNLKQAKIAIGSGGFLGKGLGNATQSALGFLPEAPTDFVFCVLAEQFGFLGSLGLLLLYGLLLFFSFRIAYRSCDLFGTLIVMGIVGMWVFQIFENIGMDCGLMPITGIPLPFISYGSSFMLVNFMCVGLILSIWRLRMSGNTI